MMIDNFNIIADLIRPEERDNIFFLVQIVPRVKDHPNNKNEGTITAYYIQSAEELFRRESEIKMVADIYHARAYINITPKSYVKLQQNIIQELIRKSFDNQYPKIQKLILSEAGKLKSDNPKWIIDLDDVNNFTSIVNWLAAQDVQWVFVPTKSYGHIITKSKFNTNLFIKEFPGIDIHKNSMGTLLYMNL